MSPSAVWLAALVVFCIVEAATVGLVSIWFAAGAVGGLIASFLTPNIWAQAAVFLALSFVCLLAVRPWPAGISTPGGRPPTRTG